MRQPGRLTSQHKEAHGAEGIFGSEAKTHDTLVRCAALSVMKYLKDIENVRQGILVGKNNDQDLMVAGNAIERAHKNISEIANFMLSESHFPYVLFLEGSNFLTKDITIKRRTEEMLRYIMTQVRSTG